MLHTIIFDEMDAICKSRGSVRDGTGVSDSIVNQLLSKIDGVDSLNNILVIGMTNRKDMIDEAILRAISASRCVEAPSRHRGDSCPSHNEVGGFFFEFEAVRASRGRFSRSTGETSSTAPASGRHGAGRRGGRPSPPARRRRAPGRLGQPQGPRAVATRPRTGAVDVIACVALRRRGA